MTPNEYADWFEERITNAATTALSKTAGDVVGNISDSLPSSRKKTKQAVRYRITTGRNRITARIGLRFPKQYRIRNTQTERLFRRSWQRVRTQVFSKFEDYFFTELKGN